MSRRAVTEGKDTQANGWKGSVAAVPVPGDICFVQSITIGPFSDTETLVNLQVIVWREAAHQCDQQ